MRTRQFDAEIFMLVVSHHHRSESQVADTAWQVHWGNGLHPQGTIAWVLRVVDVQSPPPTSPTLGAGNPWTQRLVQGHGYTTGYRCCVQRSALCNTRPNGKRTRTC